MSEYEQVAVEGEAPVEKKASKKRSAAEQAEPEGAEGDISLSCRDCSSTFFHTVADQAFFAEKGFEQLPVRCGPCRKAKKANMDGGAQGGRGGFGGSARPERGNGCFNCGKEGHMSRDCTEPRKAGGAPGGGACFKCGEMGHKSFDCPQGGSGGGGRGGRGGYGGGRGGGRGRY